MQADGKTPKMAYSYFYVPATEARPNPAKALASTTASATERYKDKDKRVFKAIKHEVDGVIKGAYVTRIA